MRFWTFKTEADTTLNVDLASVCAIETVRPEDGVMILMIDADAGFQALKFTDEPVGDEFMARQNELLAAWKQTRVRHGRRDLDLT